jgi:hypothetical protein
MSNPDTDQLSRVPDHEPYMEQQYIVRYKPASEGVSAFGRRQPENTFDLQFEDGRGVYDVPNATLPALLNALEVTTPFQMIGVLAEISSAPRPGSVDLGASVHVRRAPSGG